MNGTDRLSPRGARVSGRSFRARLRAGALAALLCAAPAVLAGTEGGAVEYRDREYDYAFRFPPDWEARELPEGEKNRDIRVAVRGPGGSSFMVVVDRVEKTVTREEFQSDGGRAAIVEPMIREAIAQTYEGISRNIGATAMKIGDRKDLSNGIAVKFYISTLHTLAKGDQIIVAGIHAVPFSGNHRINFIMTARWHPNAKRENELLQSVFNSFHLIGEPGTDGTGAKP